MLALSRAEQERELADFAARLREWAEQTVAAGTTAPGTVSVEIPVYKGGWIMPAIESVLNQTSADWSLSLRWDGGDDLSRRILELLQELHHPKIHVHFGENRGIAYNRRFLTEHSSGEFIIPLDDDDMLALEAVETFLAAARRRPWAGIIRAKRDFIDEVGRPVDSDPWFPFELRHYQHGMVQDVFNHSQPTIISRAAYDKTLGWAGFEEFRFAGEDCDLYIKIEEVAPIELLDAVLYHYRISDRRTSLVLTDAAAFEMWRRLADAGIARLGLPLRRTNERPPFTYERLPRPVLTRTDVDVVVWSPANGPAARNEAFARTTAPVVCFVQAGHESVAEASVDELLKALQERDADAVAPGPGSAAWLSSTLLLVRREVVKAVAGFQEDRCDLIADKDFSLKARQRDFVLTRVESMAPVPDAHASAPASSGDADWLMAKWEDHKELLGSVSGIPADFRPLYDKGVELAAQGKTADAMAVFQRVTKLWPKFSWGHHSLGDLYLQLERWPEAVVSYRKAIPLNPDLSWSHHHLGNALSRLGHWADAVNAYRRAIDIEPGVPTAHKNLGFALMQTGEFTEAAAAFEAAIALDPQDFWSHYTRGDAYSRVGRWAEAVDAYTHAIELRSDVPWAHINLGSALVSLKQWEQALESFDEALRRGMAEFWPHYGRGDALSGMERWPQAADAYEEAVALQPTIAGPFLNLGMARLKLEQWNGAATAFRQAIEIEPQSAAAYVQLGNALSKLEQWADAVDVCRRAADLDPSQFWAHQFEGVALLKLRAWEESEAALQRAIALKPDFAWSHHYLGDCLIQLDRLEDAAAAFRTAIALEPDLYWAHKNLGETLLKLRRPDEAVDACRGAIAVRPDLSGAYHHLGDALVKSGRWDEAAIAYQQADEINPAWSRRDLGPGVAALEARIEELAAPSDAIDVRSADGRTLWVLDSDYGELTTAMYLLLGQDLAHRTRILLPPRLFVINKDSLPGRTAVYRSMQDVLDAVDAFKPAIVVLASGYLYPIHELFLPEALQQLVDELTSRGCRLVTTDPFLGLLSSLGTTTEISIDIPENASAQLRHVKEVQDKRLIENFTQAVEILRGLPHLYPVFPARPGEAPRRDEVDPISFFNPRLLLSEDAGEPAAENGTAQWVFVLASRDYEVQVIFHGKDWFIEVLAAKLEETVRAGKHAVFIGPYDCVQAVIQRLGDSPAARAGVTILTFCSFKRFSAVLLNAEYVFYWNALSHSMFLRLFNERPVFLFDRGHLVRNVVPLYERIVDWYYQGWEPIYIDQQHGLDAEQLKPLAEAYRRGAHEVAKHVRRSPLPEAMTTEILRREPPRVAP